MELKRTAMKWISWLIDIKIIIELPLQKFLKLKIVESLFYKHYLSGPQQVWKGQQNEEEIIFGPEQVCKSYCCILITICMTGHFNWSKERWIVKTTWQQIVCECMSQFLALYCSIQQITGRKHVSHVVCYSCCCTILLVLWGRLCIIICYTPWTGIDGKISR